MNRKYQIQTGWYSRCLFLKKRSILKKNSVSQCGSHFLSYDKKNKLKKLYEEVKEIYKNKYFQDEILISKVKNLYMKSIEKIKKQEEERYIFILQEKVIY